jgi:hypothetical protein
MTISLEDMAFEQQVEIQEKDIEDMSEFDQFLRRTKEMRKAMKLAKKRKSLALGKRLSSFVYHIRILLKILLIGVVIGVSIFLLVKAIPVAQ